MPTHAGPQRRQEFTEFDELFVRCFRRAADDAMRTLLSALPGVEDGEVLEGQPAFEYMSLLRERMVDATRIAAEPYDAVTWLLLIRRLSPHALSYATLGSMETDGDSTDCVAENLVGDARGATIELAGASVPIEVSMRLARLMALAHMVDSLEAGIRSASKGVKYRVGNRRRPKPVDSDDLRASLQEFDARRRWQTMDQDLRLSSITSYDFTGDPPMLVSYRFSNGSAIDETWTGPYRTAERLLQPVQFTARAFTTGSHLYTVIGRHGALASFDAPAAIASLVVFGHALLTHVLDAAKDAGTTVPHLGTMLLSTHTLTGLMENVLQSARVRAWLTENGQDVLTGVRVLEHIRSLYQSGRRSYPGPIMHLLDEHTLVDVWAYAWHVTHDLKLTPDGGRLSNLTGEQFELAVQELIDGSVLAPPEHLRDLRGRVLRLDRRPVTDVDAILVAGRTLFLVSCKRFLTRVDYLSGEYAAARSGTNRLNAALSSWAEKIETFRASPVGDNYDFSGYDIEGFVLLPELVFTPRADARRRIPFGDNDLAFTRVESFSQFAAMLDMASWPREPPALRRARLEDAADAEPGRWARG